jgi:ACS family glucarate transporter-like MFS transporter
VAQTPTFVRWRVFVILAMGSFVAYVLRSDVSIAAPVMMKELGLSELEWGWVLAAFTTSYAIFQFPGGIFGDKMGPRKALALIASFWSICMLLTVLVPSPAVATGAMVLGSLMAVRFLVGCVQAPIFPVINTTISRWFPVGGWALPTGLSSTGLTLGFAAAAPVMAWLVAEQGWRTAFVIVAPLGFVVSALWWWYARDYPADHPSINEAEVKLITANHAAPVLTPVNPPGWVRILTNRNIILLTLSYFCSNFVFYSTFSWFFYYAVTVRGFDSGTAGYVTSSQWIAGAVGAALGGWLCDHLVRKFGLRWGSRWPIILGQAGCAIFLVIGAFHGNAAIAVSFLALCFFFQQITEGSYWSSSIAIGNQFAGAAGGVINTGANAMGIVNALFVPLVATTFSWQVAIGSGAVFATIALVLMLFVRADEAIDLD